MSEQPEQSEQSEQTDSSQRSDQRGGAPEADTEHVEGHEVFVARDEAGITSVSEAEEGADPRVGGIEDDGASDDNGDDDAGHEGGNDGPDAD